MKTIVEALQDLYVALGGKESDVSGLKLNPDVIEQIAALVNEGALNELPAVTIEDAGDVLTVDNSGKWGKAAPSGGGIQLYGPYYAISDTTNPVTIPSNDYDTISLPIIKDASQNDVSLLDGCIIMPVSITGTNVCSISEYAIPIKVGDSWTDAYVVLYNAADIDFTPQPVLKFYSTLELSTGSNNGGGPGAA